VVPGPPPKGCCHQCSRVPGAYLGPVTAAFAVTAIADGRAGLARWGRRLVRWRVGARWYLFGLAAVPVVGIAATFAIPGAWADVRLPPATALLLHLPVPALQIVTTGLAEEPGWRDFAQPRLQDRFGPLTGSRPWTRSGTRCTR
jgi:membrane protease YdiL (CAAX protease family)